MKINNYKKRYTNLSESLIENNVQVDSLTEDIKEIDHTKTTKDGYYLDPSKGFYGIVKIENGKKLYLKSYKNDNPKWCQDYTYQVKYKKDKAEEIINKLKGMKDKISDESLKENIESFTEELDKTETGMSSVFMDLINQEYSLLSQYESAQITFNDHDENKFDELFNYIKDDINIHIGMLQAAIEDLNPSAEKIDDGKNQGEDLIA